MKTNHEREQKLIDLTFSIVGLVLLEPSLQDKPYDELMEWVAAQLRASGFDTEVCGASWGVLKK